MSDEKEKKTFESGGGGVGSPDEAVRASKSRRGRFSVESSLYRDRCSQSDHARRGFEHCLSFQYLSGKCIDVHAQDGNDVVELFASCTITWLQREEDASVGVGVLRQ